MTRSQFISGQPQSGRPIRAALIGYGRAGRLQHGPQLEASPDFELSVVVTGDAGRAMLVRANHPGATIVSTVDELWSHANDFDFVVIASPNVTHIPYARAAMRLGIPVVMDKPIATNAADARGLVDEAKTAGVPLTVYQNRRWDGDFLTVSELIADGALGEVYEFESRFTWWEPEPPRTWKAAAGVAEGGGALFDLGPHVIDQAIRLFGPVVELHAQLDRRRPGSAADDDSLVLLTHEAGVRSRLWMSCVSAQDASRFRVMGSRAAFVKPGLDPQEAQAEVGIAPTDPRFGSDSEAHWGLLGIGGNVSSVPTKRGDYAAFYRDWASTLRDGTHPAVDPADSIAVLEIIESLHSMFPVTNGTAR